MLYFIDESGDFTISKEPHKRFILAAITAPNFKDLQIILRRARKTLPLNLRKFAEIKGSRAPEKYKHKIFDEINKSKSIELAACVFGPNTIPKRLLKREGIVYALLLKQFLERLGIKEHPMADIICDDRSLPGTSREEIKFFLQTEFLGKQTNLKNLNIDFSDSASNAGLQVVHWVAWATYQWHVKNDDKWLKILGNKSRKLRIPYYFTFKP